MDANQGIAVGAVITLAGCVWVFSVGIGVNVQPHDYVYPIGVAGTGLLMIWMGVVMRRDSQR